MPQTNHDDGIESGIEQCLEGLEQIERNGKYRERVAALETAAAMSWFDNFDVELYERRQRLVERLAADVTDEDVPDTVAEELLDDPEVESE